MTEKKYRYKSQIGNRSFNNVNIEVSIMETLRWKYLEKLFPNCVKEISLYCEKEEIIFEDLWFDNIELLEFFDKRGLILQIRFSHKYNMFCTDNLKGLARNTVNLTTYFNGRLEAQVAGILNAMKMREKQILAYLEEKRSK